MQILGIAAFIVALLFSVMLHEFGHFLTARRYGMRISEFFVGFERESGLFNVVKQSLASKRSLQVVIAELRAWHLMMRCQKAKKVVLLQGLVSQEISSSWSWIFYALYSGLPIAVHNVCRCGNKSGATNYW